MAARRSSSSPTPPTPEICPVCGEDVPPRALACPECGADHRSGWREDAAVYDGTGLPEGEFDYDEFVREEFGGGGTGGRVGGLKPIWWVTAVVLLLVFVVIAFRVFFFFPF